MYPVIHMDPVLLDYLDAVLAHGEETPGGMADAIGHARDVLTAIRADLALPRPLGAGSGATISCSTPSVIDVVDWQSDAMRLAQSRSR